MPSLLRKKAETHPNIVVDVRLGTSDTVQQLFASGEANVTLFNDVTVSGPKVQKISTEPLVWVMSAGGQAVEKTPLPLAMAEIGCAWRHAAINALESRSLPFRIAYSSDTSMGQVAALSSDLAIAALPKSLAKGGLIEVPADYKLPILPNTNIYLASDGSDFAKAVDNIASQNTVT